MNCERAWKAGLEEMFWSDLANICIQVEDSRIGKLKRDMAIETISKTYLSIITNKLTRF